MIRDRPDIEAVARPAGTPDDTDDPMRMLTIREVAAYLQVSAATVRRLDIPTTLAPDAHGTKRQVRGYRLGDLQAWYAACSVVQRQETPPPTPRPGA